MPRDLDMLARRVRTLLLLAPCALAPIAHAEIRVELQPATAGPLKLDLPPLARLSNALEAAPPAEDCPMQRALLRPSARQPQRVLQQGLVYDLQVMAQQAALQGDEALARWAHTQARFVAATPITGRIPGQRLDLERLAAVPAEDRLLQDGDRILMPACSNSVYTLRAGAIQAMPYRPGATAEDYLESLPRKPWHQPGEVIIVRCNGTVERARMGPWRGLTVVRPGAADLVFRPIRDDLLREINPALNDELARWFATQVWSDAP